MAIVTEVRKQNTSYRRVARFGTISDEQKPYVVSVDGHRDGFGDVMLFEMNGYGLTDDQVNEFLDQFKD